MKIALAFMMTLGFCLAAFSQTTNEVQFYEPHQLDLNVVGLKPNRIEFKEISFPKGKRRLDAYRYLTIDHIQAFGEKQLKINWEGLTAYGTGLDINFVSASDLSLYARITPRGVPLGYFLESHAFPKEANIIAVNPDADFHPELKGLSSSTKSVEQRPTQKLPFKTYNSIIFPFVFATMELSAGKSFIVPDFGPYLKGIFYYRVNVIGQTEIKDAKGNNHNVFKVEGIRRRTLKEARDVRKTDSGGRTIYYVSDKAPYFFGKESINLKKDGSRIITRRWILSDWQLLKVNMGRKQEEMINEWEKVKKSRSLKIPWQTPEN